MPIQKGRRKKQDHDFCIQIGQRIRQRRNELGISQFDLAGQVDMKPAQLFLYESGTTTPGVGIIWRLARALRVTTDWLITGTDRAFESEGS